MINDILLEGRKYNKICHHRAMELDWEDCLYREEKFMGGKVSECGMK